MTAVQTVIAAIADHHRHFGTSFGPVTDQDPFGAFSDHLPMAALARIGLGDKPANVLGFIQRYRQQLNPIDAYADYQALLQHYLFIVGRDGIAATLAEHLPRLISGWVREAYHPLIRIAYGWEFGIGQEVAAGLAYFDSIQAGADSRVARVAESATLVDGPAETLFEVASRWRPDLDGTYTFTQAAQRVIESDEFAQAACVFSGNLKRVTSVALDIFASTHNFFALHLVTGSHAFRLLYDFAGPHADAIFNLGLAAGYAAIGAPRFDGALASGCRANAASGTREQSLLGLCSEDEHDYKLAYSAKEQAKYFADHAYLDAAAAYLRRPSGNY